MLIQMLQLEFVAYPLIIMENKEDSPEVFLIVRLYYQKTFDEKLCYFKPALPAPRSCGCVSTSRWGWFRFLQWCRENIH